MTIRRQLCAALLSLSFFVACAPHLDPQTAPSEQKKLYRLLLQSIPSIDHHEAKILSDEAIRFSRKLASDYHISTPPLMHNFLINIGLKDRGLCYQWSDDLYLHLQKFHFRTMQLKPVGAYIGSYWREHNALVVLPQHSSDLSAGILLDAWRHAGKLYFIPILKDPAYHWKIRTDRCDVYKGR